MADIYSNSHEPKAGTKDYFYLMGFRAYMTNREIVDAAISYGIRTNMHSVSSRRWHFNNRTPNEVPTCEAVKAHRGFWYRTTPALHLVAAE